MDTSVKPWDAVQAAGPLLRPTAAAAYLGIGRTTFFEQQKCGVLPPSIKIGPRAVGVPQCFLDAVIAARVEGISE